MYDRTTDDDGGRTDVKVEILSYVDAPIIELVSIPSFYG